MVSGTLQGHASNFRTQRVLIAAQYGGSNVVLEQSETSNVAKSPFLKLPQFTGADGLCLWDSNAIAAYVGGSKLSGLNPAVTAEVQQWTALADTDFYSAVAGWVFPSLSLVEFEKKAVEQSKTQLLALLKTLNQHLLSRTYLVGERITLADVSLSTVLLVAFQHVLDASIRADFVNVVRWFETLINQNEFKAVVGTVQYCTKVEQFDAKKFKEHHQHQPTSEKTVQNGPSAKEKSAKPAAAAAPAQKSDKKEKKEKEPQATKSAAAAEQPAEDELDAADEALAMEPKKPDPFDAFPKGTFNLEEFKRVYSNKDTLTEALPYFWQNFDKENFSIWYSEYKYPSELTMVYMSCNLIAGMYQRLEKLRKNAFASLCLFGSDNNSTISGIWVWKSHELVFTLSDDWQTDYESYEWKKLDANSDETKTLVQEYFAWEGNFGGKKFNQGKIFK